MEYGLNSGIYEAKPAGKRPAWTFHMRLEERWNSKRTRCRSTAGTTYDDEKKKFLVNDEVGVAVTDQVVQSSSQHTPVYAPQKPSEPPRRPSRRSGPWHQM